MTKRRLCGVLFGTLLLVLGLGGPGGTAASGAPKVAWSPCHRDLGPFECGTAQVPLDYNGPDGGTVSIAVDRLPASDPARRIGSLFVNPGGPGGSGFDMKIGTSGSVSTITPAASGSIETTSARTATGTTSAVTRFGR